MRYLYVLTEFLQPLVQRHQAEQFPSLTRATY
jgi:hypothetical protein